MPMKNLALTSALILLFILQSGHAVFSEDKEEMTEEQIVYLLKNEDALLETRKIAADKFFADLNDEKRSVVLEVLKIRKESDTAKLFRVHLEKKIFASRDQKLFKSLRDVLENRSESLPFRQSALSIMWQADLRSISPIALRIVENIAEPEELRVSAMERLSQREEVENLTEIARKIALDKNEALSMRRTCFGFVESMTDKEEMRKFYQDIILNSSDQASLRRFLVMKGIRSNIENFPEILIKVVVDSKNDAALRQTALFGLQASGNSAVTFLPELRRLLSAEPNPEFKEDLRRFIEKVENENR